MKNIVGDKTDDYVLFVDMLGTSDILKKVFKIKVVKFATASIQQQFAQRYSSFVGTLWELAIKYVDVDIFQLSDGAFAHCKDLTPLVELSRELFQSMTSNARLKYGFQPIRAAIGQGLIHFDSAPDVPPPNFKYANSIGLGNVTAAGVEKKGPKGMRLFISSEIAQHLPIGILYRQYTDTEFGEINWLNLKTQSWPRVDELMKLATTEFASQHTGRMAVGLSILDLLNWK